MKLQTMRLLSLLSALFMMSTPVLGRIGQLDDGPNRNTEDSTWEDFADRFVEDEPVSTQTTISPAVTTLHALPRALSFENPTFPPTYPPRREPRDPPTPSPANNPRGPASAGPVKVLSLMKFTVITQSRIVDIEEFDAAVAAYLNVYFTARFPDFIGVTFSERTILRFDSRSRIPFGASYIGATALFQIDSRVNEAQVNAVLVEALSDRLIAFKSYLDLTLQPAPVVLQVVYEENSARPSPSPSRSIAPSETPTNAPSRVSTPPANNPRGPAKVLPLMKFTLITESRVATFEELDAAVAAYLNVYFAAKFSDFIGVTLSVRTILRFNRRSTIPFGASYIGATALFETGSRVDQSDVDNVLEEALSDRLDALKSFLDYDMQNPPVVLQVIFEATSAWPSASPSRSVVPSSTPTMSPSGSIPTDSSKPSPIPSTDGMPTESPKPSPAPSTDEMPTDSPKPSPAPSTEAVPTDSPKPSPMPSSLPGANNAPSRSSAPSISSAPSFIAEGVAIAPFTIKTATQIVNRRAFLEVTEQYLSFNLNNDFPEAFVAVELVEENPNRLVSRSPPNRSRRHGETAGTTRNLQTGGAPDSIILSGLVLFKKNQRISFADLQEYAAEQLVDSGAIYWGFLELTLNEDAPRITSTIFEQTRSPSAAPSSVPSISDMPSVSDMPSSSIAPSITPSISSAPSRRKRSRIQQSDDEP